MRFTKRAIVAVGVAGVAAGGGAVAMAATGGGTKTDRNDPGAHAARAHVRGADRGDPAVRDVLEAVRKAVVDRAPAVVGPLIDQAVKDGTLTQAQADTARQALADIVAGKRPSADAMALLRDDKVRALADQAREALAKEAPGLAAPIVKQAVADGKITQAQADTLTQRIQAFADRGPGRGPGFGPRGGPRGPGGPGGPGHDPRLSPAEAAVHADVEKAIAKQAPTIAAPIIDQAVKDGKLTRAQADALTQRLADRAKRAGG